MKTTYDFKCKCCNDVFTAVYDTHEKKALRYYKCKCGKAEVQAAGVHLFYPTENAISMHNETEEVYSEDVIEIPDEIKALMIEVHSKGNAINELLEDELLEDECYHKCFGKYKIGFSLIGEDCHHQTITIKVEIKLLNEYGWTDAEIAEKLERFKEALEKFIAIQNQILEREIDFDHMNDIDGFIKANDFYDVETKQLELYDYTCKL